MNQPDNEKQVEQAPAEPLKVRTSVKAGQLFGGGTGEPNQFIDPHDPSYSAVGVSGPGPMDFGAP